jgi:hypothetical protein
VRTFDPLAPRSAGGAALYHTGVLLSECTSFQRMAESADAVAALTKIVLGVGAMPWDGVKFTKEQIDELFCQGHLCPPDEDDSAVSSAEKSMVNPLTAGEFYLTIRTIARESEVSTLDKKNNFYLWFLDENEALRDEMIRLSLQRECPRLRWVRRSGGPAFSSLESEVPQGCYIWCEHVIAWGDLIG